MQMIICNLIINFILKEVINHNSIKIFKEWYLKKLSRIDQKKRIKINLKIYKILMNLAKIGDTH